MKGKKAMRKAIILLLICAVAAAVSGCAKGNVTGDGGDQTEEYRFAGYYNWFLGQEEYKDALSFL